jgi:hypothetical protein
MHQEKRSIWKHSLTNPIKLTTSTVEQTELAEDLPIKYGSPALS